MSASASTRPSGIKPPSRLVRPAVGRPSILNGSGETNGRKVSDDLTKKKLLDEDGDADVVGELPSLPGSRRNSEQRKLSDGSGIDVDELHEMNRRLSEAGVRRTSDASIVLTTDTDSFIVGERVYVNGIKPGSIQYIGETKFAPGEWAGIVLDDLSGKNDGSVAGVRYFQCQPKKGVFSRLARLTRQPMDPEQLAALQQKSSENGDRTESEGSSSRHTSPPPSAPVTPGQSALSPVTPSSSSVMSVQCIGDLRLGDRVIVTSTQGSKAGTLRYLGSTEFAVGQWAGVELDDALGKNDGAVAGTRYFQCQMAHGLFAPVSKVSRSPANSMRRTSAALMNSSMCSSSTRPGGLARQGTRDSFGSSASVISTASRVRQNNPRLGVTSLTSPTHSTQKTSKGASPQTGLQDLLREKEQHIEQLLKEREMERCEVTRAAAQADEAEHQLALLQRRYQDELESVREDKERISSLLANSESARSNLNSQIDDLQFRLEEETIIRSETECQHKLLKNKVSELMRQLEEERLRAEQLEREANRSFEAEETVARYKDELDALKQQQQQTDQDQRGQENEQLQQLQEAIRSKNEQLQQLQDSFDQVSKTCQEMQQKNLQLQERCENLSADVDSLKEDARFADDERRSENEKRREAEEELEKCTLQLKELRNEFQAQEDLLKRVQNDKSIIESELLELSKSSSGTSQDLTRLHTELLELRQSLSDNGQVLVKLEQEKSQLVLRSAELEQMNSELQSRSESKDVTIQDLLRQGEAYKNEFAVWEQRLNSLTGSLQDLEARERNSMENIASLQKTVNSLESEKMTWLAEKEKLEEALKLLKVELGASCAAKEEFSLAVKDRDERMRCLAGEVERLRQGFEAHRNELQTKLQETMKEAEAVQEMHTALEQSRFRVEELEVTLQESQSTNKSLVEEIQRNEQAHQEEVRALIEAKESAALEARKESEGLSANINLLSGQLQMLQQTLSEKETELREEMQDRDKCEEKIILLQNAVVGKDGEIESLHEQVRQLEQQVSDSLHLKAALSTMEREKRCMEEKIVDLQVAVARNTAADAQTETDSRVKKLKEDYEMSQREINFLNSVIVDMQKKVDDMKLQLQVSQATLLGQNINEHGLNGIKTNVVAPRLFCDICDLFDLHDTEDCPKQSSFDSELPPSYFNHSSPAYNQHSQYGAQRGISRPYCDSCEVFGHDTGECPEDSTY